jgi:hypothetical protein
MNNGEGVVGEANIAVRSVQPHSLAFVDNDARLRLLYPATKTDKVQAMLFGGYKNST